ncbi:hypothetical protein HYH02_001265 [Chlamydomonas schloesseri]|uniref:Uncharacterized protein n=1 Tax=Chlamydomonas schloesseri TaxID=2026947 RepID=A0A835WX62_9CHLO|nr:hypothetical protein HYH02_001265 [Chlamydomonas schloesseri]|eukprot:KAG2454231.1 hypothetical protein HYH02_001265 [Chlamydomonas schloesseri]
MFIQYASIGKTGITLANATLDGAKFAKLCRESKFIGGGLTPMDVEGIFLRVSKGFGRINYDTFLVALEEIAAKKRVSVDTLFGRLAEADPMAATTKAQYVRHHDDKSTYTGVYKAGGPRNLAGAR